MRRAGPLRSFLRPGQVFGELLDAGLDVALDVFGTLVFRNGAQHLLETRQPVAGLASLAVGVLGLFVFRCDVGRHS